MTHSDGSARRALASPGGGVAGAVVPPRAATTKERGGAWLSRCGVGIRTAWSVCGLTLALWVALEGVYRVQGVLRRAVASATRAQVPHPYADQPWFPAFQAEYRFAMQWEPYLYWRHAPQRGRYINVDSVGHRRTVQSVPLSGAVRHVLFLGGSAMWGIGARDEMTIPSLVAARLAERGVRDVAVTNFGETGYVFTQELFQLELELRRGGRPDVVVFYDGFNDIAAAVIDGRAGVPANEPNRVAEFGLGRALGSDSDLRALGTLTVLAASRSRLLRRLRQLTSRASGAASGPAPDSTARDVVRTYAATAQLVEGLARRYGFRTLYFWQPALHTSLKPLAPYERVVRDSIEADPFQRRLRAVDVAAAAEIDAVMADMAPERFVNLTHMFDEDTATVFIDDLGHATEQANGEVAARMLGPLLGQLACAPARQGLAPRRSCK